MITPAFALTATERVLPRLALDFTTAVTDARVTTTRALNTATRVNASGLIETVNANLPRYDFDPVTTVCLGQLIEESRANLLTGSNDFSATYWPVATNITVATDNATSPDGTVNADKLTDNTTPGVQHRLYRDYIFAASAYTLSAYLKRDTHTWVRLLIFDGAAVRYANYNLATGLPGEKSASTTSTIKNAGNGYYRCTMSITAAGGAGNIQLVMLDGDTVGSPALYTGTGTSFWAYGAQLEAGAFATSYIPTDAVPVVRNADVVSMTGTNFSSWYNQTQGALGADFTLSPGLPSTGNRLLTMSGVNGNDRVVDINATTNWVSYNGTVNVASGVAAVTSSTVAKAMAAYAAGSYALAINGNTPGTASSALLNTATQLYIGSYPTGAAYLNGHIRNVRYWPQRLTNAEVQAFSK